MDSLPAQGPINNSSYFVGDHLNVINYLQEEEQIFIPTSILDDKMPFLEMLHNSMESQSPQLFPFKDANFETLVRLHNKEKKPCEEDDKNVYIHAPPDPESCVTAVHDVAVAEEEGMPSPSPPPPPPSEKSETIRRKRKRTRGVKNREEVENQRMTHIAVERNRRRQMNDHLGVLRSLMPTSYIQRGDQASIIGGAIDFVKELEQLLESLEAEKKMRRKEEGGLLLLRDETTSSYGEELGRFREEVRAEKKTEEAEIEVTVIERHVNLKVECKRKAGQLVKALVGLEDLRLTVLHLNITSSLSSVLYSFNLKIEEECKLVSASEIAGAVQEIFMFINGS